jgi:DNA replication protein DnaC
MGYVTKDVPVGHPDFGRAFPCVCNREALLARQSARLRAMSNLDVVGDMTFDTFILNPQGYSEEYLGILNTSHETARGYAEQPQGWLLFQGNYGCGKTHLAVAIANHQLDYGAQVLFMTTPDLLDHLRSTFGPSSEIQYDELFERLRAFPLLILDDLGAESATPWAQEKLYQLLNHRYLHRLCTVVTTNSELDRIDPRIRSRLVDRSLTKIIKMPLPDFRRTDAAREQSTLSDLSLYNDMVFETFDQREYSLPEKERRNLREAFQAAFDYAHAPEGWLLFIGVHGCGKTHLAAAIANYRRALGEGVMLVTVPDLLDYLRAAFNPAAGVTFAQRFYEIRSAPLLVLDQVDVRNATPWALAKIRQIVDYRYLAQLPTVFTTTQALEELDPLIRSRLSDTRRCHIFSILVPDYMGGFVPPDQRQRGPSTHRR